MSCGSDEVQADVDSGVVIVEERTFDFQLFLQVVFKLCVDVIHNGLITVKEAKKSLSGIQGSIQRIY